MRYFPVFMDLRDQWVLVVGGGAVAERKIRLLLKSGARVRVVARELGPAVRRFVDTERVEWLARAFAPGHLAGARLVFAASDDAPLNRAVYAQAEARGLPVNVVDDRAHCRFITPAIIDRHPLQVAVSSGGSSPVLARLLRGWIEGLLPAGIGRIAEAAGRLRQAAARLPLARRRRFWDGLLTPARLTQWSILPVNHIEGRMRAALASSATPPPAGKVFLVGAGPGRAELLTLRALQLLGQADMILHDRLVEPEVLDLARRDAEIIDVGKRAGRHRATQDEIHRLLAEHARAGRLVVRLKGGDPFVFGRGGEELQYLRERGIDYEVVPGVTAASACAAFAGIPLTHRELAHSLTLVTGHSPPGGKEPAWAELAGPGRTLAVYMGVRQADRLRRRLLAAGLAPQLPVALIADGSRESQQVQHGTLADLPALAARTRPGAPGLFIIGEVAALGEQLAWFQADEGVRDAA